MIASSNCVAPSARQSFPRTPLTAARARREVRLGRDGSDMLKLLRSLLPLEAKRRSLLLIIKTVFYNIIDHANGSIMLDFELLRAFVAVADCGGFRRAAERLNLTQSTISQQIKRLELETKRSLFRRTTRSVALTDDGEMLLGDARRLLQLGEAARHRLAAPRLFGSVRLGVVEEVAGGSLPSALGRFAALHPGVKARGADRRQRGVDRTAQCGTARRGIRQASARDVEGASGLAQTHGVGRGRHVRPHSRRGAAAGPVSRTVRIA